MSCRPVVLVFVLTLRYAFSAQLLALVAARSMQRWQGNWDLVLADFATSVALLTRRAAEDA